MTIGFFPAPYPDELLYSVCARYAEKVGYPNRIKVIRELFGSGSAAIVDLPKRLNHFLNVLPPNDYSFETLLAERTVFGFFAHFSPLERLPLLRSVMSGLDRTSPRIRIGVTKWGFKSPAILRFCPECVVADRKAYKETYWHRIHHLSGIDVCAIHHVALEDSSAGKEITVRGGGFFSADTNVGASQSRRIDPRLEILMIRMADDAKWLLEYNGPLLGASVLRERYHNLLLQRGYAYYNGGIGATKLLRSIRTFYSEELLSAINCTLVDHSGNWLYSIMSRNVSLPYVQHPIRHLLLIHFLGLTVHEVFDRFVEYKPFGDGPWPCHNKASDHFGELTATCQLIDHPNRRNCPLGIFICKCGFIYTRFEAGPENMHHNSVLAYGPLWEERLVTLWLNIQVHIRDVASELGVCEASVMRHALRLKLPVNIPTGRRIGPKSFKRFTSRPCRPQRNQSVEIRRRLWLDVREKHPQATRKELMGFAHSTYLWLRRFDEDWIESNLPPVNRRRAPNRGVPQLDWQSIDKGLALKIREAAFRIRATCPEAVRASKAEIIREVGHKHWLESASTLRKLPNTKKALVENVESLEEFKIRVVRLVAAGFIERGIRLSKYRLACAASLRSKSGKSPRVRKELDIVFAELQRKVPR